MNKIVRENYPVSALPDDLRQGLDPSGRVRVTIDEPENRTVRKQDVIAILDEARRLPRSSDDSVERIRSLRDEWNE